MIYVQAWQMEENIRVIEFLQNERDRYMRQGEDLKDRVRELEDELRKLVGVGWVRIEEGEILEAGSKEEDEDGGNGGGEGLELDGEGELPPGEVDVYVGEFVSCESSRVGNGDVLR